MISELNSPERFKNNLKNAGARISKADEILGEDFFNKVSQTLSEIISHCEEGENKLITYAPDKKSQTEILLQLQFSTTELETAINLLRLVNLPAVHRQIRVGMECVAIAIFFAIGRDQILDLNEKLKLVEILKENPSIHLQELYAPEIRSQGKQVQRIDPKIKGSHILPAYIAFKRDILKIDDQITNSVHQFIKSVLHPASHSSADLTAYHADSFEASKRIGAYYDESRIPIIREVAVNYYKLINHLNESLNKTIDLLKKRAYG